MGRDEECDDDDSIGMNDNGDPKNPPHKTPGVLKPILDSERPSSKDLGGD